MTFSGDDELYDAATGRRVDKDGNVVELWPGIRKPEPVPADELSPVDVTAFAEAMTIGGDFGGKTLDEICDAGLAADLARLAAHRVEDALPDGVPGPDI